MFVPQYSNNEITRYTCPRTPDSLTTEEKPDESIWMFAPESPRSVEVVNGRTYHAGWSWKRFDNPNFDFPEQFTEVHFSTRPGTAATGASRG